MQEPSSLDIKLQDEIAAQLRGAGVPGCALGVVDRAGSRAHAAFGVTDLAARRPVTVATVFHLFSATKLYTAATLMLLVEAGLVALDDPVTNYLPDLDLAYPVTLRQLASHDSGLPDTLRAFLSVRLSGEPAPSTSEALARFKLSGAKPPGRGAAYRNVNYAILGEVVTRVSGQPYEAFVGSALLGPLETNAAFEYSDAMRGRAATGYIGRFDPTRLLFRLMFPDLARDLFRSGSGTMLALREYALDTLAIGGLIGSVSDFLPLLSEFLSRADGVLEATSKQAMLSLQAQGKAGIASEVGVGLGWKCGDVDGTGFWNHEGGGAGFTSETRIYPAQGIGVVVLMNLTQKRKLSRLAHDICESIRAHLA